jgi:D-sedoheptulose 7-phosphate isomerase
MALRFGRGGRLLALGTPADAAHVAVEFTHPVIVGKRALPALALDAALLGTLGRPGDIALHVGPRPDGLAAARALGMLTVALTSEPTSALTSGPADGPTSALSGGSADVPPRPPGDADHLLLARTADPLIAREIHVTTYHLLWELVHVCLESS